MPSRSADCLSASSVGLVEYRDMEVPSEAGATGARKTVNPGARLHRAAAAAVLHTPTIRLPDATAIKRTAAGSPWSVALSVAVIYGAWLLLGAWTGHDARDFIVLGKKFVLRSHVSKVITYDPRYNYAQDGYTGYDGQFAYYIALDPLKARYYVDDPVYRYTRIVYPMLARLFAWGNTDLIPVTLILVNLLALAGGTLGLAAFLRRMGTSPWFALIYGFYPGLFVALRRDLTEPLAYALVILGIYLFHFAGRRRVLWSALAFSVALLTREAVAVFAAIYGLALCAEAWKPREILPKVQAFLKGPVFFALVALVPLLAYEAVLIHWIGHTDATTTRNLPSMIPFGGLMVYWPWMPLQLPGVIGVVLPALVCLGVALWGLHKLGNQSELWLLVVNIVAFVIMLSWASYGNYFAIGRVAAGVVLAAILCLPTFNRLFQGRLAWLWVSSVLWLAPWDQMTTLVAFYQH